MSKVDNDLQLEDTVWHQGVTYEGGTYEYTARVAIEVPGDDPTKLKRKLAAIRRLIQSLSRVEKVYAEVEEEMA